MKIGFLGPFASFAALAAFHAAMADTVPPADFFGSLVGDPTTLTSPGGLTSTVCNPTPDGCETQTLTESFVAGDLAASSGGTASGVSQPQMQSYGDADFYFEISGSAGATASLVFSAAGSTSVTEPSYGTGWARVAAYVSAIGYGDTPVASSCSTGAGANVSYDCGSLSTASSFSSFTEFTAPTNTLEYVEIAFGSSSNYGDGSYFLGIDPMISFAPDFNADGFTLEVSPSVAGVPEPAAWTMMLGGFLGLGALLRRARRQTPAPV